MESVGEDKIQDDLKATEKADSVTPEDPTLSRQNTSGSLVGEGGSTSRPGSKAKRNSGGEGMVIETGKKKKNKRGSAPPGAHKVTFTITISKAVPKVDINEEPANTANDANKKKKRIVEEPKVQSFYHSEYFLLPDDDDPVKTDVILFGIAAKIFTERQDAKMLKTWVDGDSTWVAWTHSHPVTVTDDVLMKLFDHTMELRIWDTREKLSTRAKFDRQKAFRLPQAKAGEDADGIGGVKSLVLKQATNYENIQPKRPYIDRPLPGARIRTTTFDKDTKDNDEPVPVLPTPRSKKNAKKVGGPKDAETNNADKNDQPAAPQEPMPPTQDGQPVRSYSRLARLATTGHIQDERETNVASTRQQALSRGQSQPAPSHRSTGAQSRGTAGTTPKTPGAGDTIPRARKNRKAEAAAQAAAEHARKYGIACIPIRMANLFAGMSTVTGRLDKVVANLHDVFVTVSVSGPLMSEEQQKRFNPLIVKVQSASCMPSTPINYADLRLRCQPAYVKYKFFNKFEHTSISREQDGSIYWDDINVILAGIMDPAELREYLSGPGLEIEVHDRDRIVEKAKLSPTLFGDDLEDEKISNVGTVTSKRTANNPFGGKDQPWDPYGVAKFDLSELLLGQQILYLTAPIHMCPLPDLLGTSGKDEKLIGVSGAVDGPVDQPLPAGHYLQSNAMLKIKLHITYPLTSDSKVEVPASNQCPFSRIIFKFDYQNIQFLHRLQGLVTDLNANALELSHLPQHVIDAALSTYKLSLEQQQSGELDIITGFQVLEGKFHLFVLEGLSDRGIMDLWEKLPKPENTDVEVLYNSELRFGERLYGPLDVDLCRIKLHEALDVIIQQPLLYVRDMVPKPCLQALTKLHQMTSVQKLRDVVRNDLFPTAEMVISMSREFGVPLTTEDFEELQPETEREDIPGVQFYDKPRTSRVWTPIDNFNPEYLGHLYSREETGTEHDYISENIEIVKQQSDINMQQRYHTAPASIRSDVSVPHNYSTQTLNSTEKAKEKLRQKLSADPDQRYTYCPDYHHSMTVVPVDVVAVRKKEQEDSRKSWKTEPGWIYPGKKTMIQSNIHPMKPDPARKDELYHPWKENTLHTAKLQPTLERDRYTWSSRKEDMNVWTKPDEVFGKEEPVTIHLAGEKRQQETLDAQHKDQVVWKSKVVVEDPSSHFHRCLPETEMKDKGFKSSNQLDRLQGLLKDPPQKLSLKKGRNCLRDIPPLNVVLNPSVDTAARNAGMLPSDMSQSEDDAKRGFVPGPYKDHRWNLERNKIPIRDYEHQQFARLKGKDFNVYHKERNIFHKKQITPLTNNDFKGPMFKWPQNDEYGTVFGPRPKQYFIPDRLSINDYKSRNMQQERLNPNLAQLSPLTEKTMVEAS